MMSTRRTFATAILLVLVLFLLPEAVAAQEEEKQVAAPTVTAVPNGYGGVRVIWKWEKGSAGGEGSVDETADVAGFKVRYEQRDDAADGQPFGGFTDVISGTLSKSSTHFDVSGLQHGNKYLFGVQGVGTPPDKSSAYATVAVDTLPAPVPDKLTDVEVTPGDGMLMVEWEAGDGNGVDVIGYDVEIEERDASGDSLRLQSWSPVYHEGDATMATISGLKNGTTYGVRVRAKNGSEKNTPPRARALVGRRDRYADGRGAGAAALRSHRAWRGPARGRPDAASPAPDAAAVDDPVAWSGPALR